MDTIFRTKQEPQAGIKEKPIKATEQAKPATSVEPPYLDYQSVNSRPYVVDYYSLGDTWDDPMGGFPKEVSAIEGYLRGKIQKGEIANSLGAVKDELKKLEKMTNVSKEERPLVKIETLAAYIQFLLRTDDIKYQLRRYGNANSQ